MVWKEGRKCGLVPAGDLTPGLVCRADLRINMNKKEATSSLRISDMNTYGVTCIPARRSYGEDKCGPYVYLKAASSSPTAPTSWTSGLLGHFCIHKNRTTTPPPTHTHCHFLLLHALISFFSSPSPILCCFPAPPNLTFHRDISQLVTDSCSAAAPSPPPRPLAAAPTARPSLGCPEARAARSRADCTRGRGRGDHSLLSPQLVFGLDDVTVHLKGKFLFFGLCACSDLSSRGWQRIVYADILFKLGRNL